jgi:hypothetical protein
MEEYTREILEICIPFAIAQKTIDPKTLYGLMDKVAFVKIMEPTRNIHLLQSGNSCALDSVLVALFSFMPDTIDTILEKKFEDPAKQELQKYLKTLNEIKTIEELRKIFHQFPHKENFQVASTKDAGEFLIFLLEIFQEELNTAVKLFQSINTKGEITYSRIDRESSPIQYITSAYFSKIKEQTPISDFLFITNDTEPITVEKILQAPFLVFLFERIDQKPITLTEIITLPNGDIFYLGSIVMYSQGHYNAYIRSSDWNTTTCWYLYDDMKIEKQKIGTFEDMLKATPNPETNGVLYFYFPQYSCIDDYYLSRWDGNNMFVGVFEDIANPTLEYLASKFDNIVVDQALKNTLSNVSKVDGSTTLYVLPIDKYLKS